MSKNDIGIRIRKRSVISITNKISFNPLLRELISNAIEQVSSYLLFRYSSLFEWFECLIYLYFGRIGKKCFLWPQNHTIKIYVQVKQATCISLLYCLRYLKTLHSDFFCTLFFLSLCPIMHKIIMSTSLKKSTISKNSSLRFWGILEAAIICSWQKGPYT